MKETKIQSNRGYKGKFSLKRLLRTRRRKLLATSLAVLILASSLQLFLFLTPKEVRADTLLSFDEGYGTTVNDSSGSASGTITGATWKTSDLCFDEKCLFFDGSDWISFGDEASFDFAAATDFTIEFWFRHAPASAAEVIIQKYEGAGGDGGYRIQMESDGDISFGVDDANGGFADDNIVTTAANYDDNRWHHVAAVKDGTTGIYLYLDSHLVVSDTTIGSTGNLTNNDTFYIGDSNGADGGDEFIGFLDEVKIYTSSARTQSQINADVLGATTNRGTSASFGPDDSFLSDGLVGYWKMEEAGDATRVDSSGNGNGLTESASDTIVQANGKYGYSGEFQDADTEYLEVTDASQKGLDLSNTFTFSAWLNVDTSPGNYKGIFAKADSNGNISYGWSTDSSGVMRVILDPDGWSGGGAQATTNNNFVNLDTWEHYTVTYDGNTIRLYRNGEEQINGGFPHSTTISIYNSTSAFRIGNWGSQSAYYDGMVDEARVYNRTLSPSEIRQLADWAPGPIAHWKLDENTGTSIYDSSGNNLTGSFEGAMDETSWVHGKFGSALAFDPEGTDEDDRVEIPANDVLDSPGIPLTVEGWIFPSSNYTAGTRHGRMIRRGNIGGENEQYQIEFDFDIQAAGFRYGDQLVSSSGDLTFDVWQHIAGVYDGTNMKLFLNGIEVASDTETVTQSSESYRVTIGSEIDQYNNFSGNIDEVKIYNYARTREQIIEDMNAGHPAPGSPIGSSVLHYKFDEGYGDTANDSSPQNNDGDLAGTCPGAGSCPTWINSGKYGKALDFESGSSQYTSISDNASLSITGDLTLSGWIKPESVTASTLFPIISKWSASEESYSLAQYGDEIRMYIDSASNYETTDSSNLSTGTWYHILGTYNATAQTVEIYINGIKRATTTTGTIPSSIGDDSSTFDIARLSAATSIEEQITTNNDDGFELSADGNWYPDGDGTNSGFGHDDTSLDIHAGLRFQTVAIPQGSTIQSAKFQVYAIGVNGTITDIHGRIYGDDVDDAAVWSSSDAPSDITDTSANVDWDPSSWPSSTWVDSPDISSIVEEIVGRGTWNSGNDMRFGVRNDGTTGTNNLGYTDYTDTPGNSAKLLVAYGSGSTDYFDGLIDEVKVYNFALTSDQVKVDYNKGSIASFGDIANQDNEGFGGNAPIGYWPLDENTGQNAYDRSGNGYDGEFGETSGSDDFDPTWARGKFGGGTYHYGLGDEDYVVIGDYDQFDWEDGEDFSLSAWVYLDPGRYSDNTSTVLGDYNCCSFDGWQFKVDSKNNDEEIILYLSDGDDEFQINGTTSLNDGEWYHIAVSVDRDDVNNTKVYLNGVEEATTTTGTLTDINDIENTTELRIGCHASGSGCFGAMWGFIDEAKIYNYVRTPAQIAYDFNRGKPLGHWKLDECTGTTANDSGSGGNNGTITPGAGTHTSTGTCGSESASEMWDDGGTGKRNYSLDFDGTDDYVDMNDVAELDFNDQGFTIAGWFNRETYTTDDTIVAKKNDQLNSSAGFVVWIDNSTDDIRLVVSDGDSTNLHTVDSTSTFTTTGWNHFVIVYDDSSSTASKIYINGRDDSATNTTTGTFGSINNLSNAVDFRIGSEADGGEPFPGELDDIRIYNYVLTADQIKRDYNNGAVFFGPNTGSP